MGEFYNHWIDSTADGSLVFFVHITILAVNKAWSHLCPRCCSIKIVFTTECAWSFAKKKPVNYLGDHQKWHQSSGGKTHQKYQVYNSGYYKFWFERSRWRQSPEKCFGPTKYDVIFIYQYWVDTTASGLMIHQGISS